jgi:hypothetical protein
MVPLGSDDRTHMLLGHIRVNSCRSSITSEIVSNHHKALSIINRLYTRPTHKYQGKTLVKRLKFRITVSGNSDSKDGRPIL